VRSPSTGICACVGSPAFLCLRLVIGAAMTVGPCVLPRLLERMSTGRRTALHAHRKENVFDKWIFSFQGSKGKRCSRFGGRKIKTHRAAEKVPFTIHDIFWRFINGGKSFVYKLFTIRSLSGYHHNKNEKGFIKVMRASLG